MIENAEQQQAINCKDKRILVLAGAGSGKTKTLIDKIKFYINSKKINPKNILAITFMRDAVHEIKDRLIEYSDKSKSYQTDLQNSGYSEMIRKNYIDKNSVLKSLTIRTFHSLCYTILKENGASFFDNQFKLLRDDQMAFKIEDANNTSMESVNSLFRKSVISACEHEELFMINLEQYLIENYFDKKTKGLRDPKEYSNLLNYICCDGTIVKSKSEQRIVDWFISKGYAIEYEPLEVSSSFKFKPDFKLSTKEFYIEHKSSLSVQLNDKLKALKEAGKPVFVTEEDWMHDSKKIENELMSILRNVYDGNYTANFSKEFDNRFRFLEKELSTFFKEVKQAYELAKSQNIEYEDISNLKSDLFKHRRIKKFYELLPVVWKYYESLKKKNSVLDYNDLISLTIRLFEQNEKIKNYYQDKFKCILVDEFQDVDPVQVAVHKIF